MMQRCKNVMLGTAGHVDHGKTALVKMLTGCDTDTLAEEKQRGLTIELGFAPCKMADDRIVGIVDVPGHVGFIRNMVAGAHGVDVLMLVIAADDGIMPQTREHLDILTLMGVKFGLVVMTKIDLVDENRRSELTTQIQQFVKGTFLESKSICHVSSITGEGYDIFLTELNREVDSTAERSVGGLYRQWIERSFHVKGFGTVASGIPCSGSVSVNDNLYLWPAGKKVRVRGLEVYGELCDVARAGECTAINLSNTPAEQCSRGSLLTERPVADVEMFEASFRVLGNVETCIKDHAEVRLHVGTIDVPVKIVALSPGVMESNWRGYVQFRSSSKLPIVPNERFVIRGQMGGIFTTLGGGVFLDRSNHKLRRNRPWIIKRLDQLAEVAGNAEFVAKFAKRYFKYSDRVFTKGDLADLLQLKDDEISSIIANLIEKGDIVTVGDSIVGADYFSQACETIARTLEEYHKANQQSPGIDKVTLLHKTDLPKELFAKACEKLVADGKINYQAGNVSHCEFNLSLPGDVAELYEKVMRVLEQSLCAPPRPDQLAEQMQCSQQKIDEVLELICSRGLAVRLEKNVYMHKRGVEKAHEVVLALFRAKSFFETVEFRDAVGVSRKYAVPLLDYLDITHWTVRNANRRRAGRLARKVLEKE